MRAMDDFLKSIQRRAFVTAKLATSNDDDALDLVQDSMLKLLKSCNNYSEEDWPKVFQKILQNCIKDFYRRQKVRRILYWWQQQDKTEEELKTESNIFDSHVNGSDNHDSPEVLNETKQINEKIFKALQQLPQRQQQAFLLRAWWEHSTDETANIMGCSQGSVKTHYSRANAALADLLKNVERINTVETLNQPLSVRS